MSTQDKIAALRDEGQDLAASGVVDEMDILSVLRVALEILQDQQEQIEALRGKLRRADNNIAGLMRKAARESGIALPSNVTEQVLDGGVREQEQPQGKPSWDDAPDWAQWLAQEPDGVWYWSADNPTYGPDGWYGDKAMAMARRQTPIPNPNWQDTLERRPEQEQQEGWSWSLDHCDFVHTSDTGVSHASVGEIASCLNAAGITPDTTSDAELAAMARLTPEMRARGLAFAHKSRQDAARISNQYPLEASTLVLIADFLGKLLLGEGDE